MTGYCWEHSQSTRGAQVFVSLPFGLIRCTVQFCCGAIGRNRHRLRKMLAHDRAIGLEHGRLSMDTNCGWLDAHALERVLDDIDEALGYAWRPPPESLVTTIYPSVVDGLTADPDPQRYG
jgi:hypothetical protein